MYFQGRWLDGFGVYKRFYSGFLQLLRKCESLPKKKKSGVNSRESGDASVCVCAEESAKR